MASSIIRVILLLMIGKCGLHVAGPLLHHICIEAILSTSARGILPTKATTNLGTATACRVLSSQATSKAVLPAEAARN